MEGRRGGGCSVRVRRDSGHVGQRTVADRWTWRYITPLLYMPRSLPSSGTRSTTADRLLSSQRLKCSESKFTLPWRKALHGSFDRVNSFVKLLSRNENEATKYDSGPRC